MSANFTRKPFQCVTCQVGFSTKGNWTVHNRRYHAYQPIVHQCWICGITFENWIDLSQHRRIHTPSGTFVERQRALHGAARSFEYDFSEDSAESDIYKVASDLRSKLKQLLRVLLSEGPHKISIVVITECVKANEDGEIEDKLDVPFRAPSFMGRIEDDLDHDLASSFDIVAAKMDNFHQDGSCWKMDRVLSVRVEVTLCRPLSGSCHLDVVSTPNDLKRTSCIPLNSRPCHDCFYRAIATYFVHGQKMEPSDIQCFIEKHVKKLHAKDVAVALQVQNNANNNADGQEKFNPKILSEEERKEFNRLWYLHKWPIPIQSEEEEVIEVEREVACWFCAFRFQVYTECKCQHLDECWDCDNIHDVGGECIN